MRNTGVYLRSHIHNTTPLLSEPTVGASSQSRRLRREEGGGSGLTWSAIQAVYRDDLTEHWRDAQRLGLHCPLEIFEQLFHARHVDADLAKTVHFVDWSTVRWTERTLSGAALRRIGAPRYARCAVDEARRQMLVAGFLDEREEVIRYWQVARTWWRAPIVLTGDVLESGLQYELLIGFTRLGTVLGALDRQNIPESRGHRVWIGGTSNW
jgi:hypothetical protein